MSPLNNRPISLNRSSDLFPNETVFQKSPLPFSLNPYLSTHFKIEIFSGMFNLINELKSNQQFEIPTRKTGDIKNFSENSRRRCQKLLAKIKFSSYGAPIFLTTTFHNIFPNDQQDLKKLLDNFLRSCQRTKYKFHYVWRLELQKRGAPHFHFIILPLKSLDTNQSKSFKRYIKSKWLHFLKDNSYNTFLFACKFIDIENKTGLRSYISKYVSKIDNQEKQKSLGRIWGYSRDLNCSPVFSIYLTEKIFIHIKKCLYEKIKDQIKNNDRLLENFETQDSISWFCEMKYLKEFFENEFFRDPGNFCINQIKDFLTGA